MGSPQSCSVGDDRKGTATTLTSALGYKWVLTLILKGFLEG